MQSEKGSRKCNLASELRLNTQFIYFKWTKKQIHQEADPSVIDMNLIISVYCSAK